MDVHVGGWCWFEPTSVPDCIPSLHSRFRGHPCQLGRKAVVWLPLNGGSPALQRYLQIWEQSLRELGNEVIFLLE